MRIEVNYLPRLTADTPINTLHESEDELIHWGLKKGESSEDHKYIKREWKNGRWRYWYDEPKNDSKVNTTDKPKSNSSVKDVDKNKLNNMVSKGTSVTNKYLYSLNTKANDIINYSIRLSAAKLFVKNEYIDRNYSDVVADNKKITNKINNKLINKYGNEYAEKVAPKLAKIQLEIDSKLNKKSKEMTSDEDMKEVNPNYGSIYTGDYNDNCAMCTLAYDLRKRGYDVEVNSDEAKALVSNGKMTSYVIEKCYINSSGYNPLGEHVDDKDIVQKYNLNKSATMSDKLKCLEKDMVSNGEGSRGEFGVQWLYGGGHSVVWEVEGGKVVVRDCQTNKKGTLDDYADYIKSFDYLRLDNLIPTTEILKFASNKKRW